MSSQATGVERADLVERFRIPMVWRLLGLPGDPDAKCHSPFREDRHPSFTIFDNGKAFKDFSTGEGGNVFRFFGMATGAGALNEYKAFKTFVQSKGYAIASNGSENRSSAVSSSVSEPREGKHSEPGTESPLKTILDTFRLPSPNECRSIATLRGLSPVATFHAALLGCLLVGQVGGFDSWILTDAAKKCAEARRMDGELYPAIGPLKERKAHTLKGSKKNWPLGLKPECPGHERVSKLLWVEGGPDYLAACHWIGLFHRPYDILPVTMLGTSAGQAGLDQEALELLRERRIRIVYHAEEKGTGWNAALAWATILEGIGCEVDALHVDVLEPAAKDLNDLTRLMNNERQEKDAERLLP